MTRILLGLVIAVLVSACSADGKSRDGSARVEAVDAQAVKAEMDREAGRLLPDLVATVGGRLSGMQATFRERGNFGLWDYTAGGQLQQPPGTMADALSSSGTVLEQHGFTVETDDAQKRVVGRKGNVSVLVEAALLAEEERVSALNVRMGNLEAINEGEDFAASTPPEDYRTFLG